MAGDLTMNNGEPARCLAVILNFRKTDATPVTVTPGPLAQHYYGMVPHPDTPFRELPRALPCTPLPRVGNEYASAKEALANLPRVRAIDQSMNDTMLAAMVVIEQHA